MPPTYNSPILMKKLTLCLLSLLLLVPQVHAKSKNNKNSNNSNSSLIRVSGQYQEKGNGQTNSMGFSSVTVRSGGSAQISASKSFKENGDKVSVGVQANVSAQRNGNNVRYTVNASVKRTDGSGKKANYSVTRSGNVSGTAPLGKSVTVKIGNAQGKSTGGKKYSKQLTLVLKFTKN